MIGILIAAIYGYFMMKTQPPLPTVEVGAKAELANYNTDKIMKADYSGKEIASVNIANYADAKEKYAKKHQ
jgi:sortase A